MGPDGHIASLFPPVAPFREGQPEVIATTATPPSVVRERITITTWLTKSCHSLFLIDSPERKAVWDEMMRSPEGVDRWPAKLVPHPFVYCCCETRP